VRLIVSSAVLAGLLAFAGPASAGFQAQRIEAGAPAPRLDGVLDDAAWKGAARFDDFYEIQPEDKIAAKVRTEVAIVYDSRYVYIGLRAFDPDMTQLRAPYTRRDKTTPDQDFLALYIDPTGGKKSAQFFYLNARGAISDGVFTDSGGEDYSPDFDFEVATGRFDGGWSAEVRIPLSSLAYTIGQDKPWNLLVMRNRLREQRYRMLSAPLPRNNNCMLCYAEPVLGLHDLPGGANWSITPQLVMHGARERVDGGPTTSSHDHVLSLDAKFRPNPNTTVDVTIKPDFSQIELDTPQLSGNSQFGLFVPEKRPFFLEGADIWQTPLRAINTRTMSTPSWGARYTRRDAGSDFTVLSTQDSGGGLVMLPGAYSTSYALQDFRSTASVGRANLRSGTLAVGVVGSARTLEDDRGYNRVAGPDFSWQPNATDRMRGQWLESATTAHPDANGQLRNGPLKRGHAGFVDGSHGAESWAVYGSVTDISDDFRDDNGFVPQVGFRDYTGELIGKLGKTGILNEVNLYLHLDRKFDREGNVLLEDHAAGVWMAGPLDSQLTLQVNPRNRVRVQRGGELFHTPKMNTRVEISPGAQLAKLTAELQVGDMVDVDAARLGRGGTLSSYARLRPHDRFELEPTYSISWIDGKGAQAGTRLYTENAAQLNAILHLSARDSLRLIWQLSRIRRDAHAYTTPVAAEARRNTTSLVYGHTAGLGNALYAGLTLANSDVPGFDPARRRSEAFLKLSFQR
jgi:hypothetical protein